MSDDLEDEEMYDGLMDKAMYVGLMDEEMCDENVHVYCDESLQHMDEEEMVSGMLDYSGELQKLDDMSMVQEDSA